MRNLEKFCFHRLRVPISFWIFINYYIQKPIHYKRGKDNHSVIFCSSSHWFSFGQKEMNAFAPSNPFKYDASLLFNRKKIRRKRRKKNKKNADTFIMRRSFTRNSHLNIQKWYTRLHHKQYWRATTGISHVAFPLTAYKLRNNNNMRLCGTPQSSSYRHNAHTMFLFITFVVVVLVVSNKKKHTWSEYIGIRDQIFMEYHFHYIDQAVVVTIIIIILHHSVSVWIKP